MTKAQRKEHQRHKKYRDVFMSMARKFPRNADVYVRLARNHNHQAIHVARLTRARQAQP